MSARGRRSQREEARLDISNVDVILSLSRIIGRYLSVSSAEGECRERKGEREREKDRKKIVGMRRQRAK